MCLALCLCSGYLLLHEQKGQRSFLYLGWTSKVLEEFYEESCKKQPRKSFREKIKMGDMGEQKVYFGQFLLMKAWRI